MILRALAMIVMASARLAGLTGFWVAAAALSADAVRVAPSESPVAVAMNSLRSTDSSCVYLRDGPLGIKGAGHGQTLVDAESPELGACE
jgi:hypothetical protein